MKHQSIPATPGAITELADAEQERFWRMSVLLHWSMSYVTGNEYKILVMVLSGTFGEARQWVRLSLSDFTDGFDDERGWHNGTGLAKATVIRCLVSLTETGVLVRRRLSRGGGSVYRIDPAAILRLPEIRQ
jgi:hypothetical protein